MTNEILEPTELTIKEQEIKSFVDRFKKVMKNFNINIIKEKF
jgi:hypothetical protein